MGPKISHIRSVVATMEKATAIHKTVRDAVALWAYYPDSDPEFLGEGAIAVAFALKHAISSGSVIVAPSSIAFAAWGARPNTVGAFYIGDATRPSDKRPDLGTYHETKMAPLLVLLYRDVPVSSGAAVAPADYVVTGAVLFVTTITPMSEGHCEQYSIGVAVSTVGDSRGALVEPEYSNALYTAVQSWMNSRDCVKETVDALPEKLLKKRARKGSKPTQSSGFVVLRHKTQREYEVEYGPTESTGQPKQAHWVRGHFKKRKNGLFWWRPHIAGKGPVKRVEGYIIPSGANK